MCNEKRFSGFKYQLSLDIEQAHHWLSEKLRYTMLQLPLKCIKQVDEGFKDNEHNKLGLAAKIK